MLLVYASRTNNIERIVDALNLDEGCTLNLDSEQEQIINKEFVLLTYTDLLGSIPEIVDKFLEKNWVFLRGVAGSGNRNFGHNFCGAAKAIAKKYKVPLLAEFELAGTPQEIEEFRKKLLSF